MLTDYLHQSLVNALKPQMQAECRDTEIGRKYAADRDSGAVGATQTWASGYLNSFQEWSYAKNTFDKWSALTARRLAALRGATAT